MRNVLLGVNKFTSKKSGTEKSYEVILISCPFNERSLENGSFGSDVRSIFLPDSLKGRLQKTDIGKEIFLDYEISGRNAYLTGFTVK